MPKQTVPNWLEELEKLNPVNFEIVQAVRAVVKKTFPDLVEEVKYGGILFASGTSFGGVFSYTSHVSVEFGHGARIRDEWGFLEGSGKGRRHLKLTSKEDIRSRKLALYLPLALQAAEDNS